MGVYEEISAHEGKTSSMWRNAKTSNKLSTNTQTQESNQMSQSTNKYRLDWAEDTKQK